MNPIRAEIKDLELEKVIERFITEECGYRIHVDEYNPTVNSNCVRLSEFIVSSLQDNCDSNNIEKTSGLVSIEGLDACGKTSAVEAIKQCRQYDSKNIRTTQEPSEVLWTGDVIRSAIESDKLHPLVVLHLFMLDHKLHSERVINPVINNDKLVVSDRYIDSRVAYQSVSLSEFFTSKHAAISQLLSLHSNADWSAFPEKTLFLDASADTVMERIDKTRGESEIEKFENKEFLKDVYDSYTKILDMDSTGRFVTIDAEKLLQTVKSSIQDEIKQEIIEDQ